MTHPSRIKGNKLERLVVNEARAKRLKAKRIPLSGSCEGYPGDVVITAGWGADWTGECKSRADSFRTIYSWLEGSHEFLVLKANRRKPLVVLELDRFLDLMQ